MPDQPEPLDAGDHEVPTELTELHEIIEWNAAIDAEQPK